MRRRLVRCVVLLALARANVASPVARSSRVEKLCLFDRGRPEEALLDQYALALAATDRARELRDAAIREAVGPLRFFYLRNLKKVNVCEPSCCSGDGRWRSACARHAAVSGKIIQGVSGLSVSDFNRLSRRIAESPKLKEKVTHQAYLYRVASKIDPSRDFAVLGYRGMPQAFDDLKTESRRPLRQGGKALDETSSASMRLFASLALRVEALRQRQRADLIAALNIDDFPKGVHLCDDDVLPLMSPKVRDVCANFPKQAAEIVENQGVDYADFERLLDKAQKNPLFRWRLQRTVRHLEKDMAARRKQRSLLDDDSDYFDSSDIQKRNQYAERPFAAIDDDD